ncbi:MAG: D-aminoacyl-tRNA deacylase [Thiotrichales bacterium]
MIALLQRVRHARVEVDDQVIGEIGPGLLALIGVEREDSSSNAEKLLNRVLGYRVFADEQDKMNRSLTDIGGGLLLVPQFTLAADTRSGRRPSFSSAAPPAVGEQRFNDLVEFARKVHPDVQTGRFGADMQVHLQNDGPVTFWLNA